jgi:hypothetical protein
MHERVLGDDRNYLLPIIRYLIRNNLRSLLDKRRTSAAERRAQVELKHMIVGRFLDLMLPNGKTLGACTAADCRRLGGKFNKLAEKIPLRKTVGDVLTEAEVRKLWSM